jgi:hypothetical protein
MIDFLDVINRSIFYLKLRFGDWTLSPSSGKNPIHLGPVDRTGSIGWAQLNRLYTSKQNVALNKKIRWAISKNSIILLICHRRKPLNLAYFSMAFVFFLFNKLTVSLGALT